MESMVSADKSSVVETGDVIVIDDDDDNPLETPPSAPLKKIVTAVTPSSGGPRPALSVNLGNLKYGGNPTSLVGQLRSSAPLRLEQPPVSVKSTTWRPISFILPKQSHPNTEETTRLATRLITEQTTRLAARLATGLGTQGNELDKVRAINSLQKSIGMVPVIVKPSQTSQMKIATSSTQGLPAPSPASTAPPGQTSDGVSDSVVLVLPCNEQSRDTPKQGQSMMRSLLQKSPSSQEAPGSIKSLKDVYFIQEGQKLSQLKKVQQETNVKIVTINKNGIVQPKISHVVVRNPTLVSQLKSGKKEIRAICQAKPGQIIRPLNSSAPVSSPPVVQKSSNFIPILPSTSGQFVNSPSSPATVQQLLTSGSTMIVPSKNLLASSNLLTSPPSHIPATLQEGLSNLAKEAIKSGKKHILFLPKVANISGTLPLPLIPRGRRGRPPSKPSKSIIIYDKECMSATGKETVKKSLLSNNNSSGVKDNNRKSQPKKKNEQIFFTTLRTGTGQIAVNVIHPNLSDEKEPEWPPDLSTKRTFVTEDNRGEEYCEQPSKNTSNLPSSNPGVGLVESRIKKASKLEKIVENILRSHKTDETVTFNNPGGDEPLVCASSPTIENSTQGNVTKPVVTENSSNSSFSQDKEDLSDEIDLNLKITSVYSLNPDSSCPNEPDDIDLSEKSLTDKVEGSPTCNKAMTPCFTVVERLPRGGSDPNEATMSHCSEHCRNRTLDYLCNLNLLKCECVHDQPDGAHSKPPSCVEDNVVPTKESSLDVGTKMTDSDKLKVEDHQIPVTKIKLKRKLERTKASREKIQDNQLETNQTNVYLKTECPQTDVKCGSKLAEPVINVSSLVHPVTSGLNLKPVVQENASSSGQNVIVSPQVHSSVDMSLIKNLPPKVKKVATGKHMVSLLNPSLLSPGMANRSAQEVNPSLLSPGMATRSAQEVNPSLLSPGMATRSAQEVNPSLLSPGMANRSDQEVNPSLLSPGMATRSAQEVNPSLLSPGMANRSAQEVNPSLLSPGMANRSAQEVNPSLSSPGMANRSDQEVNPSLLSPGMLNRSVQEVLSTPEVSTSKKSMGPKEFQRLLAELKVQVETKRKDMKRLHQVKKKIKSLGERHAREMALAKSSESTKKKEIKVAFPFMSKKSSVVQDSIKSGTKTGVNPLTKQVKSISPKLTSTQTLQPTASAHSGQVPDKQSPPGVNIKPVSSERITEAISSLTKYLLTTGTKVTSDNNKYFLLKVDEQHVLVKIPQNFPLDKNLTPMSTLPSTPSTAPKHVAIKPKPDAHTQQKHLVRPSLPFRNILPQSQRSATLMARINKTRSGDQDGLASTPPASVRSGASVPVPTSSAVKLDLTHLPLNSSLLPQRKKRNSELTEEERKAKRAKLEAKYPLPPGVKIKCEPDDQMDYPIDDNWTVTSEFMSASSATESAGSVQSDNSEDSVEECDEPPMLMSVLPVSPEAVAEMKDEAEDETPPLLQPMLPGPSCHVSESTENLKNEAAESSGQVMGVASGTSLSSCESGYVSDSKKSTEVPHSNYPRSAYKNTKIERLKELLKKKEMEIEEIRRMRNSTSKTE